MKSFSTKSCLKKAILIPVISLLLAYVVVWLSLVINTNNIKDIISRSLAEKLNSKVTIGRLDLGFGGRIKIKDLAVYETTQGEDLIFNIETVSFKVRLWPLLKKKIILKSLIIEKSRFIEGSGAALIFAREQREKIAGLTERLRLKDSGPAGQWSLSAFISVIEFKLNIEARTKVIKKGSFLLSIKVRQDGRGGYKGSGRFEVKELQLENKLLESMILCSISPWPVYYSFSGRIKPDVIELAHFKSRHKILRCSINGIITGMTDKPQYDLRISTNKFNLRTLFRGFNDIKCGGLININGVITGPLLKPRARILLGLNKAFLLIPKSNFYINNFAGKARYMEQTVCLEDLKGFVGNIPLSIEGFIASPFNGPKMDLTVSSYPDQLPGLRPANAVRFKTRIKTRHTAQGIRTDIENHIYRYKNNNYQKFLININGLLFKVPFRSDYLLGRTFEVPASADSLAVSMGVNTISADNLEFTAKRRREKIFLDNITGRIYQGRLNAYILGSLGKNGSVFSSHLSFRDVVLDELFEEVKSSYNLSGLLSGRYDMYFDRAGTAELNGSGWMIANNGKVSQLPFLIAMARTTGIAPLTNMVFDTMVIDYRFGRGRIDIENFMLKSPQTDIRGKGYFNSDGRIDGNIVSRFSKDSLESSSKLKTAVKFLGDRCSEIDFNFRLFGSIESPRLQWLPGEFKKNLEGLLNERRERKIDENIGDLMSPTE